MNQTVRKKRDNLSADGDNQTTISKTKIKKKMLELQKLGEALLKVPQAEIESLNLDESLTDAVKLAKRIRHREGARRQLQFIGKIIRNIDDQTIEKIYYLLADTSKANNKLVSKPYHIEQFERNLIQDDNAFTTFIEQYGCNYNEIQYARALIRQIRSEKKETNLFRHSKLLQTWVQQQVRNASRTSE